MIPARLHDGANATRVPSPFEPEAFTVSDLDRGLYLRYKPNFRGSRGCGEKRKLRSFGIGGVRRTVDHSDGMGAASAAHYPAQLFITGIDSTYSDQKSPALRAGLSEGERRQDGYAG